MDEEGYQGRHRSHPQREFLAHLTFADSNRADLVSSPFTDHATSLFVPLSALLYSLTRRKESTVVEEE